ncbi:hypothetical protein U14_03155 [Candidatus Moduliflexus flocculans]|uniref:SGNH hydrolase-type esterase domain-containing protein n=1 Tax=Candidatus Moduliflexus flocculans TaxID=1499966 RepID=A0A081BNE3_9BACT|nr:hypothetical protein U14_03155 [Candidatus Moduliflexus flocculans]
MKEMSMTKKILCIILINSASIMLILYGFEFFFSPYSDLPVNGYVKGERCTWGHVVKNNKYGFRERNFETPKPEGVYRIMVLGDSLTWGAGLAIEERYTALTENMLNQAFDDRRFEVLNFGIAGGPTVKERDILLKFKNIVQPDLIVVGFCLNDPQPKEQNYSVERDQLRKSPTGSVIHIITDLMRRAKLSYLSGLISDAFYSFAEKNGSIPTWRDAIARTYNPQSAEWQEFISALETIKNTSDELSLSAPIFAILNQGTFPDRPTDYSNPDEYLTQYLEWYHQAEKAAQNIGFLSYNHEYEIIHQLKNHILAVNILDGHPSAGLNRIYAEKLFSVITEKIIQQP